MVLNYSDLMALKMMIWPINFETAAVAAAHPRRATAVPLALEPKERGSWVSGKGPKRKGIPSPK